MLFVSPRSSSISVPLPLSSSFLLALPPPRTLSVSLRPCGRRVKKKDAFRGERSRPRELVWELQQWPLLEKCKNYNRRSNWKSTSLSILPPPTTHTQVLSVCLWCYLIIFFFCCMLDFNIVNTFSIKIFQIFSARSTLHAWHETSCLEACPLVWY